MALRSQPFRFNLWKVARVQNRSCRASVQKAVFFEECDGRQNGHVEEQLPGRKDPDTRSDFYIQTNVAPRALVQFIEGSCPILHAGICLDEEHGRKLVSPLCGLKNSALSEHLVSAPYEMRAPKEEQIYGVYSRTVDDILVDDSNICEVTSSKTLIDPKLASDFFSCQKMLSQHWESMENVASLMKSGFELKPISFESGSSKNSLNSNPDMFSNFEFVIDGFISTSLGLEQQDHECVDFISDLTKQNECSTNYRAPVIVSGTVLFADNSKKRPNNKPDSSQRPNADQLKDMHDYLTKMMPLVFVQRHDFRIYRKDMIFENNIVNPPKTTVGASAYAFQLAKLRLGAHFQYANVRLHLLKSTIHDDEGCIRVSWRLTGIPQVRAFMFWKFMPWNYNKSKASQSESREGISTFYLDGQGFIKKHQMDQVIVDKGPVTKEELAKMPGLAV